MSTIIVYDNEGTIYSVTKGNVKTPVGIPFLQTEIPEDKIPISVNVETLEVDYIDKPNKKLEQEIARLENILADLTEIVLLGGNE